MHFDDIDARGSFLFCVVDCPRLQAHLTADQRVVCITVPTMVGTCYEYALEGGALDSNQVQLVPMLGPRVSPGHLKLGLGTERK